MFRAPRVVYYVVMHTILLKITALFYLAGALAYLHFIFTLNERSAKLGRMLLLIGVILHGAGFVSRYFVAGYTPITSLFESLSFSAFAIVCVFLAFELRYHLRVLGAFVAPLAFAFNIFAALLPGEVRALAPALNSYWLPVHVILLFFGNAVFSVAFGAGIMYLLMEKELKRKKLGAIFKRLPSLDVLSAPKARERTTLSSDIIQANATALEGVLGDFGVRGEIINARPGPVVTLYELEPAERRHVKNTPGSLAEALAALDADHAFLLEGGVFTQDLIDTWLDYKRTREVAPVALRPHPYEFFLYYDC